MGYALTWKRNDDTTSRMSCCHTPQGWQLNPRGGSPYKPRSAADEASKRLAAKHAHLALSLGPPPSLLNRSLMPQSERPAEGYGARVVTSWASCRRQAALKVLCRPGD